MPGPLLHLGATVICAHGGQAVATAPNPRVTVGGQPVTSIAAPWTVAGCGMPPPPAGNGPCVTCQWLTGSARVLADGQPMVLATSPLDLRADRYAGDTGQLPAARGGELMAALALPYGFTRDGRTALAEGDAAIPMLIEQILFTMPGERVNRPAFGSLIAGLVFAGNSELVAAAAQATAHASLQTVLGGRIAIDAVEVTADDATLTVTIAWRSRDSDERHLATIARPLP